VRTILQIIVLVVVALGLLSCGTTQAQRRKEFLISHGFHLDDRQVGTYSRHYDSLGEASRDLGFSPTNLFVPINGPGFGVAPDERIVILNGWGFVVTAEGKGSLDELSIPCTVGTALVQYQPAVYLDTKSRLRLRIKSVNETQRWNPLQVTLEIAAKGPTPLALSQDQFSVHIDDGQKPYLFVCKAFFAKDAPKVFKILPENPCTVTLTTFTNIFGHGEYWSDLPNGTYVLTVCINGGKTRRFDYQWLGLNYSDGFKLVIR
jgi:hypothetical protein